MVFKSSINISDNKKIKAYKILESICSIYHNNAISGNSVVFNNFKHKYNFSNITINSHKLGVADEKNVICDLLDQLSPVDERSEFESVAVEIGLIKYTTDGIIDIFKNRIIFPIMNFNGQLIGISSLSTNTNQMTKHLNSKDSFVFNKQNSMYGLYHAKNAIIIKDSVILVECHIDQIALYNYGFHNTVSIMSSDLCVQSINHLTSLTKNIYLAFDSDRAGFKSAVKINHQLSKKGAFTKIINFSPLKDLVEFIESQGIHEFQDKLDKIIK